MNMFRKKREPRTSVEDIENTIGVVLQNRNKFINVGEIAQQNIYLGVPLMALGEADFEELSFETDIFTLNCLRIVFEKHDINTDRFVAGLDRVIDNSDFTPDQLKKIYGRLEAYVGMDDKELADKFFDVLPHDGLPDYYKEESGKIFSGQIIDLLNSLNAFVRQEMQLP